MSIEYRILRELERNPGHTQRSLARSLEVSLGKVNYVLAGLIGKGVVKVRKLTNHPEQIRWRYVLTPKGIREKARITREYLARRLAEYDALRREIEALNRELMSGRPIASGGGGACGARQTGMTETAAIVRR